MAVNIGGRIAGTRLPPIAVPLGTYTGWNVCPRASEVGPTEAKNMVIAAQAANVRAAPSMSGAVLRVLPKGTLVQVPSMAGCRSEIGGAQAALVLHEDLVISHQYKPSVGVTVGTEVGNPDDPAPADYKTKYCTDPDFIAAAARAGQAARSTDRVFGEKRIDYILKTGANWAAPIGDFKLTVDKGDPANLVSFCATGVTRIAPTQFQAHYTNFTPTTDLGILILTTNVATAPAPPDADDNLVTRVYVDSRGHQNEDARDVRIVYNNGEDVVAPKEKEQAASTDPAVADDRRTVGWLAEYWIGGQSYPGPTALVVYRDKRIITRIETSVGIIWKWSFFDTGKKVGFSEGLTHGTLIPEDYKLYDVSTGDLIQVVKTANEQSPEWVKALLRVDASAPASVAGTAEACDAPNRSQREVSECYHIAYQKSDAELNALYKQIEARLKDDAATTKLLVAAERGWVAFRDAECDLSTSGTAGGTIRPMIYTICLDRLTGKRIDDFKTYLKCQVGDLDCPVPAQ